MRLFILSIAAISFMSLALGQLYDGRVRAQDIVRDIHDFMVMDVCVAANGHILSAIAPGDSMCGHHRDIKPGEAPTYLLGNFPSSGTDCARGPISKLNLPVQRLGNTRILSTTMRGVTSACGDVVDLAELAGGSGLSVQWHDDGYGFIMGSYSPIALSTFDTPACMIDSESSHRFFRGRVIGPAQVPPVGSTGYGVFETKLLTGTPSDHMAGCPTGYRRALTTWAVMPFTYKSGRHFGSVISSHFSQVAPDGKSPGASQQMEQTYWTREFGLSRWEKWSREDWVNPRTKMSAPELARRVYASGRCSTPIGETLNFSEEMRSSQGQNELGSVYSRTIINPVTGEQHVWLMTLCEDYTNVEAASHPEKLLDSLPKVTDEAYWR